MRMVERIFFACVPRHAGQGRADLCCHVCWGTFHPALEETLRQAGAGVQLPLSLGGG